MLKATKKRLIRIYDGERDLTSVSLHKGSLGENMVDGMARRLFATSPMPVFSLCEPSLVLVLSHGVSDKGNLISFANGEVIVKFLNEDEIEVFKGGFLKMK